MLTYQLNGWWFAIQLSLVELRIAPLFEPGFHPNFLAGSSQGVAASGVQGHCIDHVPEATVMRAHALVQSAWYLVGIGEV